MLEKNKLTEGNIFKALVTLALPIMGTSFVQMAYNMTDMIWIGRIGSKAVAGVGTAGFFTWLGIAFILIPKIGAEIGVAQSMGKGDINKARSYARNTIQLNILLGLIYGACLILFRKPLIAFFNLGDADVIRMATSYLMIIGFGINFYFLNPLFTGLYNGYGDSKTPFVFNAVGLAANMILDPILIFGVGPFPALGVEGAALATIAAQLIVTLIFIYNLKRLTLFNDLKLLKLPDLDMMKWIIKLGFPVALQSGLFSIFAMFIARIIAQWGPIPMAVQRVGSQIEAISWMTAGGFSTALGAFVGQNYGAGKWDRIQKGYYNAMIIVGVIGIAATALLIFASRPIFSIFIPEEEAIKQGVVYLKILGLSQFFMCIEIATAGAFNGIGRTIPPSIVGILFTGLRVPVAMIVSAERLLGLNGVWWTISISSVFKGVVLVTWFLMVLRAQPALSRYKYIKGKI